MQRSLYIGCAGWTLRQEYAEDFATVGTHLERYARRLPCVEINSSFYRSHRPRTYERWAASTPRDFRFAVKLPKQITHVQRLVDVKPLIGQFVAETANLGEKLGPILVQLPPSLAFEEAAAEIFFHELRRQTKAPIVCEPRNVTWFTPAAEVVLQNHGVGRVAADPSTVPAAAESGGATPNAYFRWHGSPRMYYSPYPDSALAELAARLLAAAQFSTAVWCIFDNTAEGAALDNALALAALLEVPSARAH